MPEKDFKSGGITISGMITGIHPTKKDPLKNIIKVLAGDELVTVLSRANGFKEGDMFSFSKCRPFVTNDNSILFSHN